MKFHVPEMSCGHCTSSITESVKYRDPAAMVETDLETRIVMVDSTLPPDQILEAIKSAGYDAASV